MSPSRLKEVDSLVSVLGQGQASFTTSHPKTWPSVKPRENLRTRRKIAVKQTKDIITATITLAILDFIVLGTLVSL